MGTRPREIYPVTELALKIICLSPLLAPELSLGAGNGQAFVFANLVAQQRDAPVVHAVSERKARSLINVCDLDVNMKLPPFPIRVRGDIARRVRGYRLRKSIAMANCNRDVIWTIGAKLDVVKRNTDLEPLNPASRPCNNRLAILHKNVS